MLLLAKHSKDYNIDPVDWPRCHECRMPVENFFVTDTGDGIIFVMQCHGETESAELPDNVWDTMMGTHVDFGEAFTDKLKGEQHDPEMV